ncbi:DUF1801 domain-containing protein [Pollutibacter soli]|uniref:DUF1801 domain-containing protein n=1 Tax=Pollutibacter soli TaxID=3034157 RepID=UPI00301331CD
MAKSAKRSPAEQVTQHIKNLEPGLAKSVQALREIILSTDKEIAEQIKWNNPAFYFDGEMAPFDPKEYKRDIVVMNLFKGRIMLVFPSGAKIKKNKKWLEGDFKDGRRTIVFADMDDIKSKQKDLQAILTEWLSLVEK